MTTVLGAKASIIFGPKHYRTLVLFITSCHKEELSHFPDKFSKKILGSIRFSTYQGDSCNVRLS